MRRLIALIAALVTLLGLTFFVTANVGTADAATSAVTSKTYTVTRTVGPFNGEASWMNDKPGGGPDEAVTVTCNNPTANGDSIISGSAKINHKTTHGTTSKDVLTVDVLGAFWDSEVDLLKWGVFVGSTGRKGWNSVTLTVTCRRH